MAKDSVYGNLESHNTGDRWEDAKVILGIIAVNAVLVLLFVLL